MTPTLGTRRREQGAYSPGLCGTARCRRGIGRAIRIVVVGKPATTARGAPRTGDHAGCGGTRFAYRRRAPGWCTAGGARGGGRGGGGPAARRPRGARRPPPPPPPPAADKGMEIKKFPTQVSQYVPVGEGRRVLAITVVIGSTPVNVRSPGFPAAFSPRAADPRPRRTQPLDIAGGFSDGVRPAGERCSLIGVTRRQGEYSR
ncbi:MAG: hypothetical protein F4Y02_18460 [Chloroflexi bacterium]|nr:hypothetical protein [Chloroflexota bacterium]